MKKTPLISEILNYWKKKPQQTNMDQILFGSGIS